MNGDIEAEKGGGDVKCGLSPYSVNRADAASVLVELISVPGPGAGRISHLTMTRGYHQVSDGRLWEHLENS